MRRQQYRFGVVILSSLLGACTPRVTTGVPAGPAPRTSEISDGAPIRFSSSDTGWIVGRARRFGTSSPIVELANGDTTAITCAQRLQSLDRSGNRGLTGALTGFAVGAAA